MDLDIFDQHLIETFIAGMWDRSHEDQKLAQECRCGAKEVTF